MGYELESKAVRRLECDCLLIVLSHPRALVCREARMLLPADSSQPPSNPRTLGSLTPYILTPETLSPNVLGEEPYLKTRSRNAINARADASGFSSMGICPVFFMICTVAFGR